MRPFYYNRPVRGLLLASALLIISGCSKLRDLPIGNAYTAQHMCAGLFVSHLDQDLVLNRFIAPKVQPLPLLWNVKVDTENKTVTVSDRVFGAHYAASSIYRDNIGCTLLAEQDVAGTLNILAQKVEPVPADPLPEGEWPYGRGGVTADLPAGVDMAAIHSAVDGAFIENRTGPRNTTSMLVIYKGKLIAEKYALGVTADTPVIGWSMTKTITGMLIGLLEQKGLLDLDQPAPIDTWVGTDREPITTRQLLHMASGLKFNEGYLGLSDVSAMLYRKADMARYAISRPLAAPPGSVFNYATGNTLILSQIIQNAAGGSMQQAYGFYQRELFHKLDVRSAFIEFDAHGTFVGGAYGYMTPRDWARLGLFYLDRGKWHGEQVLSPEWVDFAFTPSPAANFYGAQLWINTGGNDWPQLPENIYHFSGHQGQEILMMPDRDLVVVRTGITEADADVGVVEFMQGILAAIPHT